MTTSASFSHYIRIR